MMTNPDGIYGDFEISDPLILQIINTPAFQRLKRINQYGGVNFIFPDRYQVTRYEHSLGVWYVVSKLGCSLEVQLAGLLHDIGHAAFSHMVDAVMMSDAEDYHELNAHRIVGIKEVEQILADANIKLADVNTYPELKKALPDIGADRFDYAIRDYVAGTSHKTELGQQSIANIKLIERGITFTDIKIAREFALAGLQAMWEVIYKPEVAVVYQALIDLIRISFNNKWISEDDMFQDDKYLLDKMLSHSEQLPTKYVDLFKRKYQVVEVDPSKDYDFKHVKLKSRYFDPNVEVDGKVTPLSQLDEDFASEMAMNAAVQEQRKTGVYYKVVFE